MLSDDSLLDALGLNPPAHRRLPGHSQQSAPLGGGVPPPPASPATPLRRANRSATRTEAERIVHARRAALSQPAEELMNLARAGHLTRTVDMICRSIVHLHCNRLLGTEPHPNSSCSGLLLRTREGLERAPLTLRLRVDLRPEYAHNLSQRRVMECGWPSLPHHPSGGGSPALRRSESRPHRDDPALGVVCRSSFPTG